MLEKIGLPSKPSLRGNNWVDDASHCQGCTSQFTFINRKHHCRRCGGLFCNSCTQQRMVLRGQGDSPVRICDPCKKLEEAERFEKRYGHKNRAGRGGSKLASKSKEDEEALLNQILGNEGNSISSARGSTSDVLSSGRRTTSGTSYSNSGEVSFQDESFKSTSPDKDNLTDVGSSTPEELRQQAIEEKKKYKILKAEGKSEEALKAFKKGKELERQAGALELSMRKNRKKALALKDDLRTSGRGVEISPTKSEVKEDLASELKELGWSDMDLKDAEKRPATVSLESELSSLLGEVSRKTNTVKRTNGPDKSQVLAHKKKALELKRAGNLAEAKDELKKAKILEKQIEEQELLGDEEDSDEELSSLIRSIDDYKEDALSSGYSPDLTFNFDQLGMPADLGFDDNFEVDDEDMDDPEMAAALKSLGWTEEEPESQEIISQSASVDKDTLMNEIQYLKREALNKKREGNTTEAMALLKKAKGLEMEIGHPNSLGMNDLSSQGSVITQKVSAGQLVEKATDFGLVDSRDDDEVKAVGPKLAPKSKLIIQKELLSLKKRALALRREGKLDEAEEELRKGKVLEKQLEEINNAPKTIPPSIKNNPANSTVAADLGNDDDVTDQDMSDPSYLSVLKTLGWDDDSDQNPHSTDVQMKKSANISGSSSTQSTTNISTGISINTKGEIQRELLGLKRKSLTLRRQGELEEAEEVLKMAKVLETQLEEIETPSLKQVPNEPEIGSKANQRTESSLKIAEVARLSDPENRPVEDVRIKDKATPEKLDEGKNVIENRVTIPSHHTQPTDSQNDPSSLKEDILARKRKAVILKREGKLAEAKEELRQAKLLEKHLETKSQPTTSPDMPSSNSSSSGKKEESPNSSQKPLSSRDRFKLQQESLSHKRQALKLRREGRAEEADAELELARSLEAQLEESAGHDSIKSSETADDISVEDFLDPQLMSALQALGIPDVSIGSRTPQGHEPKTSTVSKVNSSDDRKQLEEQIKTEKLKALNLKRSGKQSEAIDALRRAKLFEKKLNSLTS